VRLCLTAPFLPVFQWKQRLALAAGSVFTQLEGGALGRGAVGHVGGSASHLDLVEGAVVVSMVGAAVHGTFDARIGLIHNAYPPLLGYRHSICPYRRNMRSNYC